MLYLVATPIGNLADMTFRAVEVLKSCAYILCEDTRHSRILLSHYEISKPLKSFHKFNEASKEKEILIDLKQGLSLALITDAGTPGISDPGTKLIQACTREGIKVSSIPGACAAITALSCSGLDPDRFQFVGFLPRKATELRESLQDILSYKGTTICYESPNRIKNVLQCIEKLAEDRPLVLARELTKKFEEILRGTAKELLAMDSLQNLKGEIVLLISENKKADSFQWEHLTPEAHVLLMQETYHLSKQEAIKIVAEMRGKPKREIYNIVNKN